MVYQNMLSYIEKGELGISREAQLRALKLMKTILHADGREIFEYAYMKMSDRWQKLSEIISLSKRFSIQEIPPLFCNFFGRVRGPSPAYAWLKCEREEETNCNAVLQAANIIGRAGRRVATAKPGRAKISNGEAWEAEIGDGEASEGGRWRKQGEASEGGDGEAGGVVEL
ncbi:Tryptophan aminotransferase-related protein 3 [Sesamum alatum]|uniref:Tryptophan aminotransferase-related protein 3 n=1 Tax=Sesamum alatum TaxID=300844 RepID=A0AAE2CN71_9LAMI|nr:Tryptophan aminotransferase-related protein 3 [Sesamum alatum]